MKETGSHCETVALDEELNYLSYSSAPAGYNDPAAVLKQSVSIILSTSQDHDTLTSHAT